MGRNDLLSIVNLTSYSFVLSVPRGIFPGEETVGNYPKMVSEPWFS